MDTKTTKTFKRLESRFLGRFIDGEGESLSATTRNHGSERNRLDQRQADQPQTDQKQIIAAVEREFGFQFDVSEVKNITNVRALVEVICANATRLPC